MNIHAANGEPWLRGEHIQPGTLVEYHADGRKYCGWVLMHGEEGVLLGNGVANGSGPTFTFYGPVNEIADIYVLVG